MPVKHEERVSRLFVHSGAVSGSGMDR